MLKNMKKYGITLAFFAAVLTGLTALINELTKNTIDEQMIRHQQKLFDQIMPVQFYNNDLQKSCFLVDSPLLGKGMHRIFIARKNNTPVGVVMETNTSTGYAGLIHLLVATDFSGMVLGTRVIKHHETPGLGDKIELRLSNWILCFSGKIIHSDNDPMFSVKKDGGIFDQFTGATITPRAVVNTVKRAGEYAKTLPMNLNTLVTCKN